MGRRPRCFGIVVGAVLMLGVPGGIAAQTVQHRLGVSVYESIGDFTDASARRVLEAMGVLLQTDDDLTGSGDVACDVAFELDQPVGTYTSLQAPGVVTEETLLEVMEATPDTDVRIVEAIQWCGVEAARIGGTPWGCSDGTSFAVVHGLPLEETVVAWAHEFGHTRPALGPLYHWNEPLMLMHKRGKIDNRRLLPSECEAFREP